jgi:uncharacterized DUF497 family protein
MRFEWDETKRTANIAKHGMDFTVIADFEWETALVRPDIREDYGELREVALGFIGARLHSVVFTEHDDVVRIISLRKATRKETKAYVENS